MYSQIVGHDKPRKKYSVVEIHRCLYTSSSSFITQDWGNIGGVRTAISIRLLFSHVLWSDISEEWEEGQQGCLQDSKASI